jgi:hypothetical protein
LKPWLKVIFLDIDGVLYPGDLAERLVGERAPRVV